MFCVFCRDDDKFGGGNRRERHNGPTMDFKERDGYRPNVKLEYIDDDGRVLNEKEAFRYLSHKFHGKGPGKNKIEKRLKKSDQEVVRWGRNVEGGHPVTAVKELSKSDRKHRSYGGFYQNTAGGDIYNRHFGRSAIAELTILPRNSRVRGPILVVLSVM